MRVRRLRGLVGGAALAGAIGLAACGTVTSHLGTSDQGMHANEGDVARCRAHYAAVLEELAAADVAHLDSSQQEWRVRVVEELAAYRESGAFPVNTQEPGARLPYFRDEDGRHCAVANLMHRLGEAEFVDRMARTDNHAFLSELTDEPEMQRWLAKTGISDWEAVRIHGPAVGTGNTLQGANPAPTSTPTTPVPTPNPTANPNPTTPGGEPVGPTTPGGGGPGPSSGGGNPFGGPTTGGGGRGRGGGPTTGSSRSSFGAGSWSLWWELNKAEFVAPHRLVLREGPAAVTGEATEDDLQRALLSKQRSDAWPLLLRHLKSGSAAVRGAAVTALARVMGPDSVPHVEPMLLDADISVRERTVLALGVTGDAAMRTTLIGLAKTGTHRGEYVSPSARGLAILALGLGSHYGMDAADREVVATMKSAGSGDREQVATAAILHYHLAPNYTVGREFHSTPPDKAVPMSVRARSVELIPRISNDKAGSMEALQHWLGGPDVELRRSAAMALGHFEHNLVLPRLMTAFELEVDPLARGFILLSIGRQGGERARDFLARELKKGKKPLRPWAALSLGILARESGDEIALATLRKARVPQSEAGAKWLALGLSEDTASIDKIASSLGKARNPWTRAHAATALGMLGGDAAHKALSKANRREKSAFVRGFVAQGLGTFGRPEDVDGLLSILRTSNHPEVQALVAVALGYHGSPEALSGAVAALDEKTISAVALASALESVGLLLDRRPGVAMPVVYRRSNYSVLPSWALSAIRTSL